MTKAKQLNRRYIVRTESAYVANYTPGQRRLPVLAREDWLPQDTLQAAVDIAKRAVQLRGEPLRVYALELVGTVEPAKPEWVPT